MKKKFLYLFIAIAIVGTILSINGFMSNYNKRSIKKFLESEIIKIKIIKSDDTITITDNGEIECFVKFLANSKQTEIDLQRGEIKKVIEIELINKENIFLNIDMSYTDDSDNIRVTFYDNKSKVTQFNYMKNNYFDVIINILAIYNLK